MGISSAGYQRPRSLSYIGNNSTNSTSLTSVLNITGSGRLVELAVNNSAGYTIRVLIDGNQITYVNHAPADATYYICPIYTNINNKPTAIYCRYDLSFKKSLKIELASDSVSKIQSAYWTYELE